MSKISPVKPKELVRFLVSIGFCEVRTKGSHMIMKDKDGNMTVVPMHAGKDIPVGTLIAILRD
ncbi:MAG: type II toxin-antitoxin system HicA family toxin, partial [Candidatus Paceibacterota bacterium]